MHQFNDLHFGTFVIIASRIFSSVVCCI